ncbi:MAG: class I SAM-dependent methyltransferase [Acetatifactor sp.]|nr:class I SAM-dependent methyltransferase [Acetatifactor sp.]
MREKQVVLSKRLKMLADQVTEGNRLVDIGCDHGYLSIYLVQKGICPSALAMDVRKGPLAAAEEHVGEYGLNREISLRLSDGMKELAEGEADTAVCAGMGGKLMAKIITDSLQKARGLKELILQPQSELREFREFLREEHFEVLAEDATFEDGKYYFVMKVRYQPGEKNAASVDVDRQRVFDVYGEGLLKRRHPVLLQYLEFREEVLNRIAANLEKEEDNRTRQRLAEVRGELQDLQEAFSFFRQV